MAIRFINHLLSMHKKILRETDMTRVTTATITTTIRETSMAVKVADGRQEMVEGD